MTEAAAIRPPASAMPLRYALAGLGFGLLLAISALVYAKGHEWHEIATVFAIAPAIAVLLLTGTILLYSYRRKNRRLEALGAALLGFAVGSLAHGISFFAPATYSAEQDAMTKQACESLLPALEAYRSENGRYPASIETISGIESVPLRTGRFIYEPFNEGERFELRFNASGEFFGAYTYSSATGAWTFDS